MKRWATRLALALWMGMAFPASAHFGFLSRPRPATAYYFAVPVVAAPVYTIPPVVCVPIAAPIAGPRPFAQPQTAPPSMGSEPPLADQEKPAPKVQPSPPPGPVAPQSRISNYYDSYAVAPGAAVKSAVGRCSVSFWNLSAHDLVLKVGDQRVTLAPGRSATLNLEQQFTWQIEGREAQTSRAAQEGSAMEIVIRR